MTVAAHAGVADVGDVPGAVAVARGLRLQPEVTAVRLLALRGAQGDAIDDQIIRDYIAANKLEADKTASGLYYVTEEAGTEQYPTLSNEVKLTGYSPITYLDGFTNLHVDGYLIFSNCAWFWVNNNTFDDCIWITQIA